MEDTTAPPQPSEPTADTPATSPDRTRTGAVWVTAVGAFLLFAAAGAFVAMRWDTIGDATKLAVLGGLTGGMLAAGRALRTQLPATAGVLFHLGAFLIPVNVAAIGVHLGWEWPTLVLVEGAIASAVYAVLARTERSRLLGWAATAAVVVTAAGAAATTGIPAALLLAGAAALGAAVGFHRAATAWALIAGTAPVLTLAGQWISADLVPGPVAAMGLLGSDAALAGIVVGLSCAVVLGIEAQRTRQLVFVITAGVALCLGLGAAWVDLAPAGPTSLVGAAAAFLVIEVAAALVRRDELWARPVAVVASAAEILAGVVTVTAVAGVALDHLDARILGADPSGAPDLLVAGGLAVAAWLVADERRRIQDRTPLEVAMLVGGGFGPASVMIVLTTGVALLAGTGSLTVAAVGLALCGIVLTPTGRSLAQPSAVACLALAPLLAVDSPAIAVALGVAGSVTIAGAARLRARLGTTVAIAETWMLAVAAVVPALAGLVVAAIARPGAPWLFVATLVSGAALWVAALVLDGADGEPDTAMLGLVARAGAGLVLLVAPLLDPAEVAAVATLMAAGFVGDALRRDEPITLLGAAIAAPVGVFTTAVALGLGPEAAGLVLVIGAAGVAVGATLVVARWQAPLAAVATTAWLWGFALASREASTLASALLAVGAAMVVIGVRYVSTELWVLGGMVAIAGTWLHLTIANVAVLDAYAAPVAALLVAIGVRLERQGTSSWVSFTPAIVLLGGAALAERLAGGAGIHATVVGAVGIAAVVVGGGRRLVGPLLCGTALLVAVTVHESLAFTREVPTSAWLALGGSVLIAAGIAMERRDTGPIETGRRVMDVVAERFH